MIDQDKFFVRITELLNLRSKQLYKKFLIRRHITIIQRKKRIK